MQIHQLTKGRAVRSKKRVGRGGKRGKTSGHGMKGQKARAGNSGRPEMRDIIKRLPKLRGRGKHGLKSIHEKPASVNVGTLESMFSAGEKVTPRALLTKGVVRRSRFGRAPKVKILGAGTLSKKLSVENCTVSSKAKELVEKAGGTIN